MRNEVIDDRGLRTIDVVAAEFSDWVHRDATGCFLDRLDLDLGMGNRGTGGYRRAAGLRRKRCWCLLLAMENPG